MSSIKTYTLHGHEGTTTLPAGKILYAYNSTMFEKQTIIEVLHDDNPKEAILEYLVVPKYQDFSSKVLKDYYYAMPIMQDGMVYSYLFTGKGGYEWRVV